MKINQTKDVFGIQRDLPLNYIEREADKIFKDSLTRNHHIVIFGSSKQGKTCLRKKSLNEDQYITIHCNHKLDLYNLNINILKQSGFNVNVSETKTVSGKAKVKATFGFNLFSKVEAETELEAEKSKEVEVKELELDPEDVNDVIKALKSLKFNKFIIIEDFHYLKDETQVDFAVELKAFHENSKFTFIIVGVWLEENRLIALNGDLSGRVKSVNADEWTDENLFKLISDGEILLNVNFPLDIKNELIKKSLNNVHIVQEVCYHLCLENKINETRNDNIDLNCNELNNIINKVISQHSGRYNNFLTNIAEGFQSTELEMHKWIMYCIINSEIEKLEEGLRRNEINTTLQDNHPRKSELNQGNLTQALKSISALQVKKNTIPIILDYDVSNLRLNIVDKGFLIWLKNQDKKELLSDIGIDNYNRN